MYLMLISVNFNPRSREGSDSSGILKFSVSTRFQSTLPRRERPKRTFAPKNTDSFQSTLPRRERLAVGSYCQVHLDFNPRSREGSDFLLDGMSTYHTDFNPRSREGSDSSNKTTIERYENFNPRSREGSDY